MLSALQRSLHVFELLLCDLTARVAPRAALMAERMRTAGDEDVERYFGMLTKLVGKLEEDGKSLRDVMREMAAEYAAMILMELNR